MQMDSIHSLITAPVFDDEEKTRVARLLHKLTLGVVILSFAYAVIGIFVNSPESVAYPLVLAAVIMLVNGIARRGYVYSAAWGFTIGLWIIFSMPWIIDPTQSIYDTNFTAYLIPVLLSGFLLGGRASLITATLSALAGLVMLLDPARQVEMYGITDATLRWAALSVIFYMASVLVKLAADNANQALARARAGESALAQRNRDLQHEIEERRQTEAALQRSEQRLRLSLEVARLTIWDWDLETNLLTTMSDGLLDERQSETMHIDDLIAATHPEDRGIIPDMLHRAIHENAPYEIEFRILSKGIVWFATAGRLLRDESGKPTHVMGVSSDVTERKQAEQERVDLAVTRQRVEMLTEFLGNISHDFKTPISVINTNLYLIRRDPEKQLAKLDSIQTQTNLLDKYIQDILTMLRLNYDPGLAPISVDVNSSLQVVSDRLHPTAEKKSIGVTLELDPALARVHGDLGELDRLMVNLIENAINYTPHGGRVSIRTRQEASNAVIEIADTGIGISEEECEHIFERFYRSSRARSSGVPGTGLGLAIVKKIVDLHDGSIEVESAPSTGTLFRVTFPAAN